MLHELYSDSAIQMARRYNTTQSAHDIIRRTTENHPVVLRIQQEVVDEQEDQGKPSAMLSEPP